VGTTRKMLNTTGFVGAALVLMLLPYLHDGTSGVLAISAVMLSSVHRFTPSVHRFTWC
jgi:hypothetical protein